MRLNRTPKSVENNELGLPDKYVAQALIPCFVSGKRHAQVPGLRLVSGDLVEKMLEHIMCSQRAVLWLIFLLGPSLTSLTPSHTLQPCLDFVDFNHNSITLILDMRIANYDLYLTV